MAPIYFLWEIERGSGGGGWIEGQRERQKDKDKIEDL